MNSGAKGAEKFFEHWTWSILFSTKYMANDDFSEPPRRANSQILIFIFCRILGPGHLRGPGSASVGFWGRRQSSFLGGGASQRAVSPPPPQTKACPPQRSIVFHCLLPVGVVVVTGA